MFSLSLFITSHNRKTSENETYVFKKQKLGHSHLIIFQRKKKIDEMRGNKFEENFLNASKQRGDEEFRLVVMASSAYEFFMY